MVFDRFADQLSGLLSKPVRYLSLFLITFYSASAFAIYTVAPTSLDFATVPVGNSSGIRIVTFTNNNSAGPISFTSISASGNYSITNNCPMQIDDLSLSSGTSCTVEVVFSPQTAGIHNAQLTYVGTDEGVDFTETVALTGVAEVVTFGELSLSPASLDFGSVAVGSSSSPLPVTLTNSGNAAVDITSITTTSPFAHSNDCPPTLTASGSCTIMVTATPATDGAISGSLTATGTGPQGTIRDETTLSANGSTPDVVVSDTQLSFPDGSVDTPSQPQVVTVSNQGTAAV
ncbi:MAG: choice-of-anchor D domain-containing protein, partial [Candidatus Thiodiazotropha sp.]